MAGSAIRRRIHRTQPEFRNLRHRNLRRKRSQCHSLPGCRRSHECQRFRGYLFHHRRPRREQPGVASWRKHLGNYQCHRSFRHVFNVYQHDTQRPGWRQHQPESIPHLERRHRYLRLNRQHCLRHRDGIHRRPRPHLADYKRRSELDGFQRHWHKCNSRFSRKRSRRRSRFARHLRRHRRRCLSKSDIDRRLDRTRTNLKRGINRLSAQRRRHRARNLQFRRPKIVASFHLRSGRVAIQSAGRTGFSNLSANRYADHFPRQLGKFHRHTHIAQRL